MNAGENPSSSRTSGRFTARTVVPVPLRAVVGKRELSTSLGADRREALRKLPGVVARFNETLSAAKLHLAPSSALTGSAPSKTTWSPADAARRHFAEELAFDLKLRDADHRYAMIRLSR